MMYHRRYNVLLSILPYTECQTVFKEKSELIGRKGCLFGKVFRTYVTENRWAKSQTMAILKPVKKYGQLFLPSPRSCYQRNVGSKQSYSFEF